MAIKRFTQNNTGDMGLVYSFLTSNKEGTFLENMTLESDNVNTLHIASANADIVLNPQYGPSKTVLTYQGKSVTATNKTDSQNSSQFYINGLMLCSHGIIFSTYGGANSSSVMQTYNLALTVDSVGELSLLRTGGILPIATGGNPVFYAIAADSIVGLELNIVPKYNCQQTSLAPLSVLSDSTEITLPYAYAAIFTDLGSEGLAAVKINGEDYITNGRWYIRD